MISFRLLVVMTMLLAGCASGQALYTIIPVLAAYSSAGLFTDTFDRADSDPMNTTSSDGNTWTDGPGTMTSCKTLANNLRGAAGGENGAMVATPTFPNDQSATLTLVAAGNLEGVMVRMQAGTASGYLAVFDDATHVSVYKLVDTGSFAYTLLGSQYTVAATVAGDTMSLVITGTTLTLYINGASQGTRTDATYASGQPGVYFYGFNGAMSQLYCEGYP